jgi:alkylhydroperoxidase family enzyme
MSHFPIYTIQTAPAQSAPVLENLQQIFGFIPNIAAAMAGSPVLLKSFVPVFQNVHAGSFNERQIQTLLLTNAVANACTWAVAFHSMLALKEGLAPADVQALRDARPPQDAQLAALSGLSKRYIDTRGHLPDADLQAFYAAGYSQENALEVITVVAASTMTSYLANVAHPPLEEAFEQYAWTAPAAY